MNPAATVNRVRWHVNRLSCMTRAEIGHRLRRAVAVRAERMGLRGAAAVPEPAFDREPHPWIHADAKADSAAYLAAADRIAAGRFDLFALRDLELGSPPRWNCDPKTGVQAPLTFGMLLDHRDPQRVGDIKYLWELNRHLHTVTLAQAYALSGNERYGQAIRRHLESWFDACPYPMGPNWSSALEAGIRLINWSAAWQLLGGAAAPLFHGQGGARFRRRWLDAVFRHAQFIGANFSLYSSANNHLIGEAAGLYIAGLTWPHWPQARIWLRQAGGILEREALLQNAPDGVNREQAVSYQQFGLDLLLLPLLAARANGMGFPAAFGSRIESMIEYLASIMDAGGNVPMIGDADDGCAVQLAAPGEFCCYRSLLATGALLFERGDFRAKAGTLDDKTRWLFGKDADAMFAGQAAAQVRLPVRRAFPEGGYFILGCDFESGDEIRLVADAGPLGYQTIAAHGHADALSFTLSVGGLEFLVDPGTFAYHTQGEWRDYFRGTAAHNTLRVDGANQSRSGGKFMWLRKANAGCDRWTSSASLDLFEGWHDGYAQLRDPVVHRRRIVLDKAARRIVVSDRLKMAGAHDVELFFHCSEHCRIEPEGGRYRISQGPRSLLLSLPHARPAETRVHFGSTAPICGWVSRRFDVKQPAPTVAWKARLEGDTELHTEIMC